MLLKLRIYNRKSDPFAFRTVMGDVQSIWELHFMLKTSQRSDGLAVTKMEVSDLDGNPIDTSQALSYWHSHASRLSYGEH